MNNYMIQVICPTPYFLFFIWALRKNVRSKTVKQNNKTKTVKRTGENKNSDVKDNSTNVERMGVYSFIMGSVSWLS